MCHLPNGQGRPENASLAGLPAAYIIQQLADYKSGLRRTSQPKAGPQNRMLSTALAVPDEAAAAGYFSTRVYRPWIRVVETAMVPRTRVIVCSLWAPLPGNETEAIGQRIVEVPADPERAELRDPHSGFVAYVPPGSLARGERLATTGDGGRTLACIGCHGPDVKGVGPIPPLAGRSPSYLFRQLNDIRNGTRNGAAAQAMKPVVAGLTEDEMFAVAAFAASRAP